MNKKELVDEISKRHGISTKTVRTIIAKLGHVLREGLETDAKVSLRGFGTFQLKIGRKRFYNRFTRSLEERQTRRVKFRPSRNFKELVNHPKDTYINSSSVFPTPKSNSIVGTINEGELNLGQRREKAILDNPTTIEYHGKVSINRFLGTLEHTLYPSIKTPQLGAPILIPQKISRAPAIGITEPLLLKRLKEFCRDNTGFKLMENVAVPIKDWPRPYIPDFVLYHEGSHLFIDVEIDEPYDSKNRKPIHFIGGNDVNRDNYLISNGWIVIRYSERQIYNQLEEVIEDLHSKICWLEGANCCSSPLSIENRWTYNEAEVFAKENFREQYLGIDILQHVDSNEISDDEEVNIQIHQYEAGLKQEDICVQAKNSIINQIDYILSVKPRYVRVTLKDSRQVILDGDSFLFQGNSISGICSYKYEGRKQWGIKEIETLEPITSLFSDISWRKTTHRPVCDPTCRPILIDAAFNGAPIWIRYEHQRWDDPSPIEYETFISCLYLSSDPPSLNYRPWYKHAFTEILGWKEPEQCFYINGNRLRQFHIIDCDLLEIKVVNCINDFQNINVYKDSLKELILNPCRYSKKVRYHERVETLLTKRNKFPINDLLFLKLRAHYETIKGNIEEALNLYHSIDYNFRVDYDEFASIWGHSCIKDINLYIKQTENIEDSRDIKEISPKDLRQNFSTIKDMLIVKGWSWF